MDMNAVIENITSRRSVRSFSVREIEKTDLELILKAAIHAPSAKNRQMWRFTVLRDKELMIKLADAVSSSLGIIEPYDFYSPDTLILVSGSRENPHAVQDCSCAMQNIFLAAHSLGVGSVWINQLFGICDNTDIRKLLFEMGIPADHFVIACAALGYAKGVESAAADKRTDVLYWIDRA